MNETDFDVRGVKGVKYSTVLWTKDQRLCMSNVLTVVFVAFMQHCIQSTYLMVHMSKVLKVYSVYRGPWPLQEERLFEEPSILWV